MSAPDYTEQDMTRQLAAWFTAADRYRAKDAEGVADCLSPRDDRRPDAILYAESVALAILGAVVTAAQIVQNEDGGSLDTQDPATEWMVENLTPGHEAPASMRVAASLVAAAANGEQEQVAERVYEYASPDAAGQKRVCDLTLTLLSMFVAAQGASA